MGYKQLPLLPYGFSWRRRSDGGGELVLWGNIEVAAIQPTRDGRWLAAVNLPFHESLYREAVAESKQLACYWVHRWATRQAEMIYRARPEECSFKSMGVSAKYPLASIGATHL